MFYQHARFPQYGLPELLGLQSLSCEELHLNAKLGYVVGMNLQNFHLFHFPQTFTQARFFSQHSGGRGNFGHVCMAKLHWFIKFRKVPERRHPMLKRVALSDFQLMLCTLHRQHQTTHLSRFGKESMAKDASEKWQSLGHCLADSARFPCPYDSKASWPSSQASNQIVEKYEFSLSSMGRLGTKTVASRSWPDFMVRVIRFGAASGCGPSQKSS